MIVLVGIEIPGIQSRIRTKYLPGNIKTPQNQIEQRIALNKNPK
jgi:hypothetical protein